MEGKEIFQDSGGQDLITIPCLNDRDDWVEEMIKWIEKWRIVDVNTAIA